MSTIHLLLQQKNFAEWKIRFSEWADHLDQVETPLLLKLEILIALSVETFTQTRTFTTNFRKKFSCIVTKISSVNIFCHKLHSYLASYMVFYLLVHSYSYVVKHAL